MIIKLPCYGIVVTFAAGDSGELQSGELRSDLSKNSDEVERFDQPTLNPTLSAIDGIESMILAHAIAGIDIESPAYIEGIETAVEAS